jgi:hypothetical protein
MRWKRARDDPHESGRVVRFSRAEYAEWIRLALRFDLLPAFRSRACAWSVRLKDLRLFLSLSALPWSTVGIRFQQRQRKAHIMAEERFSDLPGIIAESSGAAWHVIRAGKELGPFSLGELVEQAVIGRIGPDDLVKQTGGLWTKARDVGPLQEQFRLTQTKQETLDRIGRFHGIWISKKNLVAGGCILLLLVGWYGLNRLNRPDAQANSRIRPAKTRPGSDRLPATGGVVRSGAAT